MFYESIAFIVVTLTVYLYYWVTNQLNYWKDQGVPYIKPKFPFGNIADMILMRNTAGEVYRDIYRQFEGKAGGGFFKVVKPVFMLRDPELVKTVTVKEFSKFSENDFHISRDIDPLLSLNPFATNGPEWKHLRNIQLPAQVPNKIKAMVPDMITCCNKLIDYIKANNSKPIETHSLAARYTGDTVSVCAFGLNSNSFSNEEQKFAEVTSGEVFCSNYWDNISILCAMLAPSIGKFFKLRVIHKDVENYFINVIKAATEYRIKNELRKNDFLQQLIDTNAKSIATNGKPLYNDVEMAGHCMTFYLDGYETTSILVSFVLYELARNPDIQVQIRDEIMQVSKDINDFDMEAIHSLNKLDNVISETLRLHPPIQSVTRVCMEDTTLITNGQKFNIKKGMSVVVPIFALQTDPEHYPEPELFKPERFNEENKALIKKFTYLPFGEGPRLCVGIRFALLQAKSAIISILLNFHITLKDQNQKGSLKMDPMSTFIRRANGGLWLRFEEINDEIKT